MHLPTPQRTPRLPAARRFAAAGAGALALGLAACGSSSASVTTTSLAPTTGGAVPGTAARPGAFGTVAAISGQSLEVQNPRSGQTTVTYTATTIFTRTVAGALAQVTVGSCITAIGSSTPSGTSPSGTTTPAFGGPVTATRVTVVPSTNGSCARPGQGGAPRTGSPPRRPASGTFPRRTATGGPRFSAAFGQVASVSGDVISVTATNPRTATTAQVTVTTTSSTTFDVEEAATPADLTVGSCVQAIGPADTTGAVNARTIAISSPGPNGCSGGFGGGFGGGGASGTQGGASA